MKTRYLLASALLLLLAIPTSATETSPTGQPMQRYTSPNPQLWIKRKLIRPESNMIFVVAVSKRMLENAAADEQAGDIALMKPPQLLQVLEQQPDNTEALLALANHEVLAANFDSARARIDQAYAIQPDLSEVYLSELLYQLYDGLIKLSSAAPTSPTLLPVSYDFLTKAQQQHPELEAPQIIEHGLRILQAFYSTIFDHVEQFKQRQPFDFKLSDQLSGQLADSEAFFRTLLQDNQQDHYISAYFLLIAAIIRNDSDAAERYYQLLATNPATDNNLHRLMMLGDMAQANFTRAIARLSSSIELADNINDRIMLAKLYALNQQPALSLSVLMDYSGRPNADLLIQRLAYAILSGNRDASRALYKGYKGIPALQKSADFQYYAMVIALLIDERGHANEHFKHIAESRLYGASAQAFMDFFSP